MRSFALPSLLLALVGCSNPARPEAAGSGSGSGSGSDAPVTHRFSNVETSLLKAPPIELPKQEAFVLVDAGKGAKSQLRYTLPEGALETHVETRLVTRQLDHGTFGEPVAVPAIHDGFAIRIAPGQPLALRALEGTLAARSNDQMAHFGEQYLATWRTHLQNRRVAVTVDARGQFSTITFNDDPSNQRSARAKDELVQRLLAMLIPVPEQPVGIGAKWQVITILRQGPAYLKQTADYQLVERTPARWKVKVKLLRVGEQQIVVDPALPAGTRAELIALFRQLDGTLEVDPKWPVVAAGKLAVESRMHAKITVPQQESLASPGSAGARSTSGGTAESIEQLVEDTGTITFSPSKTPP